MPGACNGTLWKWCPRDGRCFVLCSKDRSPGEPCLWPHSKTKAQIVTLLLQILSHSSWCCERTSDTDLQCAWCAFVKSLRTRNIWNGLLRRIPVFYKASIAAPLLMSFVVVFLQVCLPAFNVFLWFLLDFAWWIWASAWMQHIESHVCWLIPCV